MSHDIPFAGTSIILIGDFYQFPPIGDFPLYQQPHENSIDAFNGHLLFKSFWVAFLLPGFVRTQDADLQQLITDLRNNTTKQKVYDTLHSRILTPQPTCTYIVSRNAQREKLNNKILQTSTSPETLTTFHAVDTINGEKPDETMSSMLLKLPLKLTKNLPGILKIAKNVPIIITSNIDVKNGLTNGTMATVEGITQRRNKTVIVAKSFHSGKILHIPTTCDTFTLTSPTSQLQIRRRQYPAQLSFAITFEKSQGQTIEIICLDLTTASNEIPTFFKIYVGVSRVRTLSNLYVLRHFTLEDIDVSPPQELVEAMNYFESLRMQYIHLGQE